MNLLRSINVTSLLSNFVVPDIVDFDGRVINQPTSAYNEQQ
jgi:hypothetical protein